MAYALVAGTGPFNVDLTAKSKRLGSWHFSNTVAAAVINLRDGSVSGPIVARISLAINTSASESYPAPARLCFPRGLFVEAGRAQAWLAERFPPDEWPEVVAGELRAATWLMGRAPVRPQLRVTPWAKLLAWTAGEIDSLAPAWEDRDVLHRFDDGWTIERVSCDDDFDLEGRLLRHCLTSERGKAHDAIHSLRDPAGRPHVTLVVERSEITETQGRGCSRPKPAHAEKIAEYAQAAGLEW